MMLAELTLARIRNTSEGRRLRHNGDPQWSLVHEPSRRGGVVQELGFW